LGLRRSRAVGVDRGLPPLNSLWKNKPGHRGTSIDITPLVDRVLALCDPPLGTLAAIACL
jgi:hypothetical protein